MMSSGRPARKPPAFTASSMRGNFVVAASRGSHIAEHLHVLFVMGCRLADRLLAAGRDVELVAERQPLAQFELDAAPGVSRLEAEHVPFDRTALGRAAADHAADAVLGHEIEGALRSALD